MTIQNIFRSALIAFSIGCSFSSYAAPKLAVTDLAYEERVSGYFRVVSSHEKSSMNSSERYSERESDRSASSRGSSRMSGRSERSYHEEEGLYSYIERGELRKFSSDIKGELIKSGLFDLVQPKPFTAKDTDKLYDVKDRIKKGMFSGANYVLFGSVNTIEFRTEAHPIDNTDTVSYILSLELVAEFSLINTKTMQVVASFSAVGTGQDVRLVNSAGARVNMNRAKVVSQVSKSLGEEVTRQVSEQLGSFTEGRIAGAQSVEKKRDEVIIFK